MNHSFLLLFLFIAQFNMLCQSFNSNNSAPNGNYYNRAFGIHFDLHANEKMENLGSGLNEALLDSFLRIVNPDFIQVDCKGHSGISSYPTQVGFTAKSYSGDPLLIWREITNKYGVQLFVHFSGIFDRKVVQQHPDWAVTHADGTKSSKICSPYSPYIQTYIIPQLKELAGKYKIDGAWIDGECWAIEPDYGAEARKEFLRKYSVEKLPVTESDEGFYDFMDFQRNHFKNHVNTYLTAVKKEYPDFKITSNWAFSSMMPEPVSLSLDFLSGDLTPGNAVYRAAFESRCMANQGLPWDIMAWSFSWDQPGKIARNTKSALQINQELSQIMAMGGGVQVYFKQQPDLSIIPWNISVMKEISAFVHDRIKYCTNTTPIQDVGLLYSGFSYFSQIEDIYPEWDPTLESMQGCLNLLLDNQYATEIIYDFNLKDNIEKYNLIVVPNWDTLAGDMQDVLKRYVYNGGKLAIIGDKPVKLFQQKFDYQWQDYNATERLYAGTQDQLFEVKENIADIVIAKNLVENIPFYTRNDYRNKQPVKSFMRVLYGKGTVAIIPFDLGHDYLKYPHFAKREFLDYAIQSIDANPVVKISNTHQVHVVLRQRGSNDQIHLLNASGPHADQHCLGYDEIMSIRDIDISYRADRKPKRIIIQPIGVEVPFTYNGAYIEFKIDELPLYTIAEISYIE